jgi:endonuclease/exonuclease/phosphatase family metal-dependent hydrolase
VVRIFDTNVVFISCHLPATKVHERREAYHSLVESVGNTLGDSFFQLLEQFQHLVIFGDLNYRTFNLTGTQALDLLRRYASLVPYIHLQLKPHCFADD